jgi:hypothetical protein
VSLAPRGVSRELVTIGGVESGESLSAVSRLHETLSIFTPPTREQTGELEWRMENFRMEIYSLLWHECDATIENKSPF